MIGRKQARAAIASLGAVLLSLSLPSAQDVIIVSPDAPKALDVGFVLMQQAIVHDTDSYAFGPALDLIDDQNEPPNIDGLHKLEEPGAWLFSLAASRDLADRLPDFAKPWDVIRYDSIVDTYEYFFCGGAALAWSADANIDALYMDGGDDGTLVISVSDHVDIQGQTIEPWDLIRYSRTGSSCIDWQFEGLVFDGSVSGKGNGLSKNIIGAAMTPQGILLALPEDTEVAPIPDVTYLPGVFALWDGQQFQPFGDLTDWRTEPNVNALTLAPDNCPGDPNPDQTDVDADSYGDVCDACPDDPLNDLDGDGLCGEVDNCPDVSNLSQSDPDGDGIGSDCDNCPDTANPDQFDVDGDGTGNACDPDTDGDAQSDGTDPDDDNDGIADGLDNCPQVPNPRQRNLDGDAQGDACDLDDGLVNGGQSSSLGATSLDKVVTGGETTFRLSWVPESGADAYHVYVGKVTSLRETDYGRCYRNGITTTYTIVPETPASGETRFYLVSAEMAGGEGPLGTASDATARTAAVACSAQAKNLRFGGLRARAKPEGGNP